MWVVANLYDGTVYERVEESKGLIPTATCLIVT